MRDARTRLPKLETKAYPRYRPSVMPRTVALSEWLRQRADLADGKPHRGGFRFKSYEAFVYEYGKGYESAKLDRRERAQLKQMLREHREWWERGFEYNHCFMNAQELRAFDETGKVIYVEGFVWAYEDRLPPILHAWLTLHGKVIDPTVVTRAMAHPDKVPPGPLQVQGEFTGRAYFGVPFLRSHFRFRRGLNRGHGSLLNDEEAGSPLLKHGGDGAVRRRP
jgi:hypothetical protein